MFLVLGRALVAFLAAQVADTPLFCDDYQQTETPANAARHAAANSGDIHTAPDSPGGEAGWCFCPCHLTFVSERSLELVVTIRPGPNPSYLLASAPVAPSPSLDHPPQNLG